MEQAQPSTIPHLLQLYTHTVTDSKLRNPIIHISHPTLPTPQGKVTYQQTLTSETILPLPNHVQQRDIQISQNQIVVTQQGLQIPLQSQCQVLQSQCQVLQSSDMSQSLIASHVLLPQHMIVNGVSTYYSQYELPKEQCVTKAELDLQLVQKEDEADRDETCQTESVPTKNADTENWACDERDVKQQHGEIEPDRDKNFQTDPVSPKKRSRSQFRDPENWACNIRKMKHQNGEAYVSRRGKYVPERQIKNTKDCLKNCRYKCNEKISDDERKHIFKAFYTLSTNEKRYFLLSTTDRITIKHTKQTDIKRNYTFKYFFNIKSERFTVCKNFYLGTLAISQKPVYNVHKGKSDFNMPKPDGRGHACASTHSLPIKVKDRVREHIQSFSTVESKPVIQFSKKKQYLDHNLTIKKMYNMYYSDCNKDNIVPVKESMYRKIFKKEFNLHFIKVKTDQSLCTRCKDVIKKK